MEGDAFVAGDCLAETLGGKTAENGGCYVLYFALLLFYLPVTIFFISLSLLRASTGVRLLMSRPIISSRT